MKILMLGHRPGMYNPERLQGLVKQYASPGTEIDQMAPDDFLGGHVLRVLTEQKLLNGLHHAVTVPSLVQKAVWAEENGYDAVIQGDGFDPGVEVSRLAVRIPVIGLVRTNLHIAATLATRIGITVPLQSHVPYIRGIARSYGFDASITDIRALEVYGPDAPSRKDELRTNAINIMQSLVSETGAEVIIPFGGALIPSIVSVSEIEAEVSVPILTPIAIAIRFAETCVQLGLVHSRAAYPMAKLSANDFDRYYLE